MKKRTINIEGELHARVREAAKKDGMTIEGFVTKALETKISHGKVIRETRTGAKR